MHLVSANKHGKMILFGFEELCMKNNNKLLNIVVWQVYKNNYIVTEYLILHWNSSHLHILLIFILSNIQVLEFQSTTCLYKLNLIKFRGLLGIFVLRNTSFCCWVTSDNLSFTVDRAIIWKQLKILSNRTIVHRLVGNMTHHTLVYS